MGRNVVGQKEKKMREKVKKKKDVENQGNGTWKDCNNLGVFVWKFCSDSHGKIIKPNCCMESSVLRI